MELLVIKGDRQTGPFSQEQISSMLSAGMIESTDLAWHDGLPEWVPLNQIFDLSPPVVAEPPLPTIEPVPATTGPEPAASAPVAPEPEAPPAEPEAAEPFAAVPRPKPPPGVLGVRPPQPVPSPQPPVRAAVPVARPQQPRGAVPVRSGVPVAAGRTVAAAAVPRGASPGRTVAAAAVPRGVPAGHGAVGRGMQAFPAARFVHAGQPGSFGARLLAFIIDIILVSIAGSILSWPLSFLLGGGVQMPAQGEQMSHEEATAMITKIMGMASGVIFFQVVVMWLYYALMESSAKQGTLGKQWCGLLVTNMDGNRIGFGRATGRFFGKYVSALILYIGFLMCLWTEKKQCLHDIMTGTRVLKRGA